MTERTAKKRQVNARASDETFAQLRHLAGRSHWGTQTTVLAIAIDRLYRDKHRLGEDGVVPDEVALP